MSDEMREFYVLISLPFALIAALGFGVWLLANLSIC